jgi:predicted O-methyltransferase YrrM
MGDLPPGSPVANAGQRLVMAGALAALVGRRDHAARAVRAALRSVAFGRIPAEEHAWIDRIEAHRRQLPSALGASGQDSRDPAERMAEATEALKWMSLPPIFGRFLLRLVRELAPRSCLELGTGFGISTAYQAAALELNGAGAIVSLDIEGMIDHAEPTLSRLDLGHRVELRPGPIEETLAAARARSAPIDYVLLDADHTEHGTVAAFDAILPDLSEGAVVVIDDINWTAEMRRAWRTIRGRERVAATLGLWRLGIATVAGEGGGGR